MAKAILEAAVQEWGCPSRRIDQQKPILTSCAQLRRRAFSHQQPPWQRRARQTGFSCAFRRNPLRYTCYRANSTRVHGFCPTGNNLWDPSQTSDYVKSICPPRPHALGILGSSPVAPMCLYFFPKFATRHPFLPLRDIK